MIIYDVFTTVPLVNYCDGLDRCILYCVLFVFMLALLCFCVATEFSVNKDLYISRRLKTVLRRQLLQSFFFFSALHYRSEFHRSRSSVAVGEDKTRAAARVAEPSRFPASCIRARLLVSQCGLPHLSGSRENRPAWSR